MLSTLKFAATALFCCVLSASVLAAIDSETEKPIPVRVGGEPYTFPYRDPLYGTLAGYLKIEHVAVLNDRAMKLAVPGFTEPVSVHAVIQNGRAPLAVVLLGIGGRANADFSRLWPSWLAEAGYHVLYFDSTFRPAYMNLTPKGPSGNLWAEAETVRDIVDTFLKHPDVDGKVDGIGIAGMSYGGVQALVLGRMAHEGRLPFTVTGIQAYSPPVNLAKTAEIFDKWYRDNRWCYTQIELQSKVGKHKPASDDVEGAPLSPRIMRAAIALSFRTDLTEVVLRANEKFELNVLPKGEIYEEAYLQREHAEAWNFTRYAYDLALPYWHDKLGAGAVDTLISQTRLCELLQHQPAYSETIIAKDDPFNEAVDMDDLQRCASTARVTYLPTGGHLGYVGDEWTRTKLLSIFAPPGKSDGVGAAPR